MQNQTTMTVVVPARDEEAAIGRTLGDTTGALEAAEIPFEIIVVDDYSSDHTAQIVRELSLRGGDVRLLRNDLAPGFGNAVEWGIRHAGGDIVAVMMADGSDSALDLIRYYRAFGDGVDCVFGSRFQNKSRLIGYPPLKLVLNRLGNALVRSVFGYPYRDITNAFKAYKAEVLEQVVPLESSGFEVTLELPLSVLETGATVTEMPIAWEKRSSGTSKMNVLRDSLRYLKFIVRRRVNQ